MNTICLRLFFWLPTLNTETASGGFFAPVAMFSRVRDTILDAYHDAAMQKQCHDIGRELRSVPHRTVHQQINEMLYDL
jgi:hypothetical protein